jgi:phosphoenolpyruvate-protein kinase (PTS system EI component)
MDSGVGSELSRAVGREAALFENESDVAGFLQRAARLVGGKLGELSVCGDSAADPLMIPFLLGVGIRSLSVAPAKLEEVRGRLGRLSVAEAQEAAGRMLAIRRIREMEVYLGELAGRLEPREAGA